MATVQIRLNDWKAWAAAAIVALMGLGRLALMRDMTGNKELMQALQTEIMTRHYAKLVEKLETPAAPGEGGEEARSKDAQSLVTSKLDIRSVRGYLPFFTFSTAPRDVVIRVEYGIKDAADVPREETKYYRFDYRPMMDSTIPLYESNALAYYLGAGSG